MAMVLVVDDSAVERHRAGSALASCRFTSEDGASLQVHYACNGRDALEQIHQGRPDLIVSDMMMPELDGLGLVKEVRASFPNIPVVLMTAHGSEEIAATALRAGAASYVPKRYLTRDLGDTVDSILRMALANRQQQVLFTFLAESASHFRIPNDLSLVTPMVSFLQGCLTRTGLCTGGDDLRVTIALREALVNALTHGNLEAPGELRETDTAAYWRCLKERQAQSPYQDRRVDVHAHEAPAEVTYVIRDEGPGFDTSFLPDPTDPDNLRKATGRGLFLIRTFMDEVRFNSQGNEITMIKRKPSSSGRL